MAAIAPKTILLVEDEAIVALQEARQLRQEGYTVLHAISGQEAIDFVKAEQPAIDLVLMDINLGPGMDGTEVAQKILKLQNIPIVFLSSHTEPDIVAKTEKITSYGYVVKDTGITVLNASIKMAFKLHAAHQALRHTNEMLSLAQEASHAGTWDWDITRYILDWSPEFLKVFGLDPDTIPGFEAWEQAIHPEDREEAVRRLQEAAAHKTSLESSYRIILPGGENRWIRATGKMYYDDERALKMTGLCMDITESKRAEVALEHSHDLMRYVIEHNRSAVAIHDKDLRYIYVSKKYLEEYQVQGNEKDIIGKHHYDVFPDLPQKWRDVHQKALKGIVSSAEDDPYVHEDGRVDWTRWECRPWYEADGSIGGIIVYTEVINERKSIENSLKAALDEANRRKGEVESLLRSARAILEHEDFNAVSCNILNECQALVGANIGYFARLNAAEQTEIVCHNSGDFEFPAHPALVAPPQGLRGKAYESGRAVFENDFEHSVWRRRIPADHPSLANVLIAPLLMDGKVRAWVGLLNKPGGFTENDALLATSFGELAAVALRNEEVLNRSLAEKSMLLSDLQHRIKNSFALIDSLVSLEQDHNPHPDVNIVLNEVRSRIKSLAALYSFLDHSNTGYRTQLDQYLSHIARMLMSSYASHGKNIRLQMHYDEIRLDARDATSMGLILNELLTNALKYAFPGDCQGRITVLVERVENQVKLTVSDDGVGLPDGFNIQRSAGLGLQIVQMLTRQMSGTLAIEQNDETKFIVWASVIDKICD